MDCIVMFKLTTIGIFFWSSQTLLPHNFISRFYKQTSHRGTSQSHGQSGQWSIWKVQINHYLKLGYRVLCCCRAHGVKHINEISNPYRQTLSETHGFKSSLFNLVAYDTFKNKLKTWPQIDLSSGPNRKLY